MPIQGYTSSGSPSHKRQAAFYPTILRHTSPTTKHVGHKHVAANMLEARISIGPAKTSHYIETSHCMGEAGISMEPAQPTKSAIPFLERCFCVQVTCKIGFVPFCLKRIVSTDHVIHFWRWRIPCTLKYLMRSVNCCSIVVTWEDRPYSPLTVY